MVSANFKPRDCYLQRNVIFGYDMLKIKPDMSVIPHIFKGIEIQWKDDSDIIFRLEDVVRFILSYYHIKKEKHDTN